MGILGNCVFATFPRNIKHLTFAGCQSEIPFNSSQLLSNPFESEVLLPICYQIFDDVLGKCQGVFYKNRVFYLGYLTGATSGGCLTVKNYWELIKIKLHSTKLVQKSSLVRACSDFFLRSMPLINSN